MIVTWILSVALSVLGWFLSLFDFLPVLELPGGLTLTVPVPFFGSEVSGLNTWIAASIAVASALVVGKVLQWLYSLIPFKGT